MVGEVKVSIEDNVEAVIQDIEDNVIGELERIFGTIEAAMDIVRSTARRYVRDDAELSGQLRSAIRTRDVRLRDNKRRISVGVDSSIAEYGAIVELGTGDRSMQTTSKADSQNVPSRPMDDKPTGFPFSAPNIDPDVNNPVFLGMVGHIEDWMKQKGIQPEKESYRASASAIARTIIDEGNYAHPYLRPAWFEHELEVREAARAVVKKATR